MCWRRRRWCRSGPRTMRVVFEGRLGPGVAPKDMILHLIGTHRRGGRRRLCAGICRAGDPGARRRGAADDLQHVDRVRRQDGHDRAGRGRPTTTSPGGRSRRRARPGRRRWRIGAGCPRTRRRASTARWRSTSSGVAPQVTWGTSPEHVGPVTGRVPDPAEAPDAGRREAWGRALDYMGLVPGTPMEEVDGRPRLHRLLHQCAALGPARGGGGAGRAQGRRRASAPGSCRAARRSSARPRPRGSTRVSGRRGSSGASPAARNAWRRTARSCRRAAGRSRRPTATSSAGRGRGRGRIWLRPPWRRRPR